MLQNINKILCLFILFTGTLRSLNAQVTFTVDRTPATYCTGEKVTLTNTTTPGYTTLHWYFGDGTDTYGESVNHIYLTKGNYQVVLEAVIGGVKQQSAPLSITINPTPTIILLYNSTFQTLTASKNNTETLLYHWYFKSIEITSELDSVLNVSDAGIYKIIVENPFQCTDTAEYTISSSGSGTTTKDTLQIKTLNNILTPNGDGANDILFIENLGEYTAPLEIYIYNRWGQVIYSNKNYSNLEGFIGRSNEGIELDAGTYYYVVKSKGRKGGTGYIDIIK